MKFKSYSSNEIVVKFKVWAPTFNRLTHRLYLLGSPRELGAWDIDGAIPALPTQDLHIWKVEAALSPKIRFEWVWLKINLKSKRVEWERPVKRDRAVGYFSGVLHTVWGKNEEIFLQAAANVELTTFKRVDAGYLLVLTGSCPSLGEWNIQQAKVANEFPKKSGYWKTSFTFDAYTNVNFKWAVVKEKDFDSVLIMEKVPHQIYGRHTWMRVAAPWMTSSAVVVDILPMDERLDTKRGRTDLLVRERKARLMEIRGWLVKLKESEGLKVRASTSEMAREQLLKVPSSAVARSTPSSPQRGLSPSASIKVLRNDLIEEGIIKKNESLAHADRLTKQLSRNFRSTPSAFSLKGSGQTIMPVDFINADIANQVPLVECSLILLKDAQVSVDYEKEAETAALTLKASRMSRSTVALSRSNIDKTKFFPKGRRKGVDRLGSLFSGLDKKFSAYSTMGLLENDGTPEYEGQIDRVIPSIPLTWTMLTEGDMEKTLNPLLNEPLKKPTASISQASDSTRLQSARPSKMGLSPNIKKKDQAQILAEAAEAAKNYFSRFIGASSSTSLISSVAWDSRSISTQDITAETRSPMRPASSLGVKIIVPN